MILTAKFSHLSTCILAVAVLKPREGLRSTPTATEDVAVSSTSLQQTITTTMITTTIIMMITTTTTITLTPMMILKMTTPILMIQIPMTIRILRLKMIPKIIPRRKQNQQ